ncbi:hypothetical protein RFF05_05500 [Bengtsoniella intestinalis]|uniref:hypothetical protein n=1 Tax=Bengtsoniella intestinalis TaxID=3073143 RepID=UPI00391F0137
MSKYVAEFYVEKEIQAPSQVIWNIIAKPEGLTEYHPFMEKHTLTSSQWGHIGDQDLLNYYSGFVYERTIVAWIDGVGFDVYYNGP